MLVMMVVIPFEWIWYLKVMTEGRGGSKADRRISRHAMNDIARIRLTPCSALTTRHDNDRAE